MPYEGPGPLPGTLTGHQSFYEMMGQVHHVPVGDDTEEPVVIIGNRDGPEIVPGKTLGRFLERAFGTETDHVLDHDIF